MIINLTALPTTPAQIQAGVIEPTPADKLMLQQALTFERLPDHWALRERAETLAMYARQAGYKSALIDGPSFFIAYLERALWDLSVRPLHAFEKGSAEFFGTEFDEI